MRRGRIRTLAIYLLLSLVMFAPEAWAYLDPSTGSMILSAIVGMFATAALAVKTYWYKLKGLFGRRHRAAGREDETGDEKNRDKSPRPASD